MYHIIHPSTLKVKYWKLYHTLVSINSWHRCWWVLWLLGRIILFLRRIILLLGRIILLLWRVAWLLDWIISWLLGRILWLLGILWHLVFEEFDICTKRKGETSDITYLHNYDVHTQTCTHMHTRTCTHAHAHMILLTVKR